MKPTSDLRGSGRQALARLRDERGSAAAELALGAPVLVLLLLFVVLCGRLATTQIQVNDAAHQAVRAATLTRTPAQATSSARETAAAALAAASVTCRSLAVSIDSAGFRPGSTVTATISCTIDLRDLSGLGVPASRTFSCSFSSVVDTWRGATP
ncbi:TadE/TadG family type IV pilus assembly protein [Lentzea sp. NPDC051838]|uniref:TadE/TadG family type IV pilus assembly protein n=1 Tax=Lentzea sp. NPDC051838 TaxID=3154849 RepID=UPI003426B65A